MAKPDRYLIISESGKEVSVAGPFSSAGLRRDTARDIWHTELDHVMDNVFKLDVYADYSPRVYNFRDGELDYDDGEEEEDGDGGEE